MLGLRYWSDENVNLSDVGSSFEQTELFYRSVEQIVREKIDWERNRQLFEVNGEYNGSRPIDIRTYASGQLDEAGNNLNTTYTIDQLLVFAEDGAGRMLDRILKISDRLGSDSKAGEKLAEEADQLEIVLPQSGMSLASLASISPNMGLELISDYRLLCETSLDIRSRFQDYQSEKTEEADPHAPSNVAYFIENPQTKQRYTNIGGTSLKSAIRAVEEEPALSFLYVGERRFNIMTADPNYVLDEKAAAYFMQSRFISNGENILIAVRLGFPIGDRLRMRYNDYQQREPLLITTVVMAGLTLVLLLLLAGISVVTAGRTEKKAPVRLTDFDEMPTEIAAGLCLMLATIWWTGGQSVGREIWRDTQQRVQVMYPLLGVVEYWILFNAGTSLLRRFKAKTLWANSIVRSVLLGTRQVYSAKKSSYKLMVIYLGFIICNTFFLFLGGTLGGVMTVILNLAALLYLMRDVVGSQTVREGLGQISKGKLEYRIRTDALTGESREMAEAVNEMGDGLQKAVDSMLKNERLKAELITNVSHDLKTPLTSIVNYVGLLKREKIENEKVREYVEILDQKSQRLKRLTEDLLEVSRLSSGNVELRPIILDVRLLLQQACGEFEDRFEEKRLTCRLSLPEQAVMIRADGAQLWRVFENLLGNICKYAKEDTPICAGMEVMNGRAVIRLENTSAVPITVSGEELKERFTRGDASRTTEGSGLGLAIAESLLQLMEADFEIEAEGLGFAAVITFAVISEKSMN
ncbi:MAG: HAMP domain-containing sensor histidine kinase [Lachnospiraceae bacterium]|nr:HAMP domain-containing sensor histidine kinase [Lachnospiraceae bacterium]